MKKTREQMQYEYGLSDLRNKNKWITAQRVRLALGKCDRVSPGSYQLSPLSCGYVF